MLKTFTFVRPVLVVLCASLCSLSVSAQSESGFSVEEEFARELKLVEGLRVYNQQLGEQLKAQEAAKVKIETAISDSSTLAPQVKPLLNKMIVALEKFIAADLPFHLEERNESVQRLKVLMLESSLTDSERYRNIVDIYTVETEYGQTYEAYSGEIDDQPVDMLRIGRLALFAQTRDQATSYSFDKTTREWKALDSSHNRNIRKAIKVAAKTIAPELLSLPIPAPEAG